MYMLLTFNLLVIKKIHNYPKTIKSKTAYKKLSCRRCKKNGNYLTVSLLQLFSSEWVNDVIIKYYIFRGKKSVWKKLQERKNGVFKKAMWATRFSLLKIMGCGFHCLYISLDVYSDSNKITYNLAFTRFSFRDWPRPDRIVFYPYHLVPRITYCTRFLKNNQN